MDRAASLAIGRMAVRGAGSPATCEREERITLGHHAALGQRVERVHTGAGVPVRMARMSCSVPRRPSVAGICHRAAALAALMP
jgi:hypothetical protein